MESWAEPVLDAHFGDPQVEFRAGELKLSLSPGFDFLLFDMAGPFIAPYLFLKGVITTKSWVEFFLDVTAGMELHF